MKRRGEIVCCAGMFRSEFLVAETALRTFAYTFGHFYARFYENVCMRKYLYEIYLCTHVG